MLLGGAELGLRGVVRVDGCKGITRAVFVQGTGLSSLARTHTYKHAHSLANTEAHCGRPAPAGSTHYSHTLYRSLPLLSISLPLCLSPLIHHRLFHFSSSSRPQRFRLPFVSGPSLVSDRRPLLLGDGVRSLTVLYRCLCALNLCL